jgi:hypothetical protein
MVSLNRDAFAYAKHLVRQGRFVRDEHDDWSEHAPSADDENMFIDHNDYAVYAEWYLGVNPGDARDTKQRYSFPFGDFEKVHRCAVITIESRAAQNDHPDIVNAAKQLLVLIDSQ